MTGACPRSIWQQALFWGASGLVACAAHLWVHPKGVHQASPLQEALPWALAEHHPCYMALTQQTHPLWTGAQVLFFILSSASLL